jgi:hypothetical protein
VDSFAEVASEVLEVSCDQVRGFRGDCSAEDWPVFLGKVDLFAYRLLSCRGLNHMKGLQQAIEALLLVPLREVSLSLFDGV